MAAQPITVWIVGDQLLSAHPALSTAVDEHTKEDVVVLMIESIGRMQHHPYQKKKLVLLLSAMRHYAQQLEEDGFTVDYREADSFEEALDAHLDEHDPQALWMMASAEYDFRTFQQEKLGKLIGDRDVRLFPNTQFLVGRHNPIPDPEPDKRYVMENFYRDMRRHFDVLMDGEEPRGGDWNYDKQNRESLPDDVEPPEDLFFEPDEITTAVMEKVANLDGVGSVEEFGYAVTRAQALEALEHFLAVRFEKFGPYEDALTQRSHTLFHSVLSPYLNIGLLEPLEVVKKAEEAFEDDKAPINSVEGFIRQILGWREFMYWQYWRQMPGMKEKNAWGAEREVPDFFWSGETDMACLAHALQRALDTGYNHHIERLMVIGNFAMLTGLNPAAVNDWFTSVYIDAYDWVMPPNVIGMTLNADDGLTATKPYIASANYINKMGDFCSDCRFKHTLRTDEEACPFNYLYWNFILEHEEKLRANPRLGRNVFGLRHLDDEERERVRERAKAFLEEMGG